MGVGKVFKKIGAVALGIGTMGAYNMYKGQRESQKAGKRMMDEQRASYEQQASAARSEQVRMNERLSQQQARVNAGIARGTRSRARGGIFGDSQGPGNQNPLNAKLG